LGENLIFWPQSSGRAQALKAITLGHGRGAYVVRNKEVYKIAEFFAPAGITPRKGIAVLAITEHQR
jgi:hypothetical protein